ncbi:MAG: dephospho-CoA kinase [Muribaculaceae bacterium]|nr:dephospho-CoA kinase [Muribaculaceae bacterium]
MRNEEEDLTCICGGIGSGKSVVSRIMRLRGYGVYDCDHKARLLMIGSRKLLSDMESFFEERVVTEDGVLKRDVIAAHIFGDSAKREWLNQRVHAMVRDDLTGWFGEDRKNLFVESAIPAESGLIGLVGRAWLVTADEDIRVKRVEKRNGLSGREIRERIDSQKAEEDRVLDSGVPVVEIINQ